jgi:sorbitol-6-phosphate 2-dehydrogenase
MNTLIINHVVPAGRGCRVLDVVRAINYVIEQEYETGQAISVTSGQNMLNQHYKT